MRRSRRSPIAPKRHPRSKAREKPARSNFKSTMKTATRTRSLQRSIHLSLIASKASPDAETSSQRIDREWKSSLPLYRRAARSSLPPKTPNRRPPATQRNNHFAAIYKSAPRASTCHRVHAPLCELPDRPEIPPARPCVSPRTDGAERAIAARFVPAGPGPSPIRHRCLHARTTTGSARSRTRREMCETTGSRGRSPAA